MEPVHARLLVGPQRACSACPGSTRASPSGWRSAASVSASQGPATSGSSRRRLGRRRHRRRCRRRPAGAWPRRTTGLRSAARRSIASNCSSVRLSRSRSTSTHLPRMKASPSDCASSRLISAAVSVSPSSVTSIWKSSSASRPELRRRLAADRRLHLRARRPVHAPARRHAHDHAGAFERRHVLQELQRLLRAPAQRMKDLAGIDHGLQPGAVLGGALHRHQQRQQALAVLRAGIFLQGLAERQMLRLGLRRQPRRVGRQEGERRFLVLAVLGQIEMHAPDQVPGGIAALEELLNGEPGFAPARHRRPHPCRATDRPGRPPSDIPRRSWAERRRPSARARRRRARERQDLSAPSPMPGSAHSAVT